MSATSPLMFAPKRSRRYTAIILMVLLVLSCVGLIISAQSFRDRTHQIRVAESDNGGWLIAQLDVDHKALNLAVDNILLKAAFQEFSEQPADMMQVHLRFDIFYSRVETVIASLQRTEVPITLTERLYDLDNARNRLAAQIEAINPADTSSIVKFANEVRNSAALIRDVSVMGMQLLVTESERARMMERELLIRFWVQSIVLLMLMTISAILALRLWREQEERALRMSRAAGIVAKAFEAPLGAVVIADLDDRILMVNTAAGRIFGVDLNEMVGRTVEELMIPPRLRAAYQKGMENYRKTGYQKMINAGLTRITVMRPNGEEFAAEVSITADTDLDGRPILIGFLRDISEVVAAEGKLRAALDEAERHASAKTMFLATMSHEMRTPLHGLIASLDLLDPGALDLENKSLIQTARHCSQRALQQINEVLEITRLRESEMGGTPFLPVSLAQDILNELTPLARKRGTTLDLIVDGERQDRLCFGLAPMFSRALYNLAGNAVKFTVDGEVLIFLRFSQISVDEVHLHVEVRDNGIGIPVIDQERIFGNFETMSSDERSGDGGTGLGLPIARLAVQRMGGALTLKSAPMEGSAFSFEITLPFASESVEPSPPVLPELTPAESPRPAKSLDVLVVDDNEINLALMAKIVQRIGHTPNLAMNGLEAVEMTSKQTYDVILMDVSMPMMDGREATRQIRAGGKSTRAFIIGVTAFNDSDRNNDLCHDGMDTVLTKPASQKDVAHALNSFAASLMQDNDAQTENTHAASCVAHTLASPGAENTTQANHEQPELDVNKAADALSEMVGHDNAIRFLDEALAEVATLLQQLGSEPKSDDIVENAIHRAVGSTAVVGLSQLAAVLLSAEDAARKRDQESLRALVPSIDTHLQNAAECLNAWRQI